VDPDGDEKARQFTTTSFYRLHILYKKRHGFKASLAVGTDVKLSLCLIKHHLMKTYGGLEVFITSALDESEGSASLPRCCIPGGGGASGTHCV
jgi:hypothetical protein